MKQVEGVFFLAGRLRQLTELKGTGASETHAKLLISSYKKWTGKNLIDLHEGEDLSSRLFQAKTVILSHGTEADPILNYGNRAALELWEMDWDTFTKTPSRFTAEPMERAERERFLQAVNENGYVDNYTGVRISSTGKRFYIVNAIVWNLIDDDGKYAGQAAAFREYRYC